MATTNPGMAPPPPAATTPAFRTPSGRQEAAVSTIPTLRWGILGPGKIATKFARALPRARHATLAAVASRSPERATAFAAAHGVPRVHDSYAALLADPGVDAVYIATPHPEHARWTVAACEAGKHVLCEKPFALNAWEAEAMIQAAREHRVFLMEAFMYRCHPQTARVVELVRGGAIGEVKVIRAAFGFRAGDDPASRLLANDLGGGGILDVGGYPVSFARLIAGAVAGTGFADPLDVVGAGHLGATGVDEYASAVLRFPGDLVAEVCCGVRLERDNEVVLYGTEGTIRVDHPWLHFPKADARIEIRRRGQEPVLEPIGDAVDAYACEIDLVAQHVSAGQAPTPAMSWDDSLGQMRTLDRWRQAIGLVYEREKPPHQRPVRGALTRRRDAAVPRGMVPGLAKPMSRLVLGCDNQHDFRHGAAVWDDWFERGGNAFDTAFVYGGGAMERNLGQWIASRGVRDEVVVIAKGAHTPFCQPSMIGQQLTVSLERLTTPYADLYLMHRDDPAVPVGEFVDALDAEVRAGRIRAFGGSNWSPERVAAANTYARAHGRQGFTVVSNNLSLARMVDPVWKGCVSSHDASRAMFAAEGIALLPWSSQARGFFLRGDRGFTADAELVRCWYSDDNFARLARAQELARRKGVQPIHIALAWVLHQPCTTFPLIGPRTIAETASSLEGLAISLTPAEVAWLDLERDDAG